MRLGLERAVAPMGKTSLVRIQSSLLQHRIQKFIPNHPCTVWIEHTVGNSNNIYILNTNNPALKPYDRITIN